MGSPTSPTRSRRPRTHYTPSLRRRAGVKRSQTCAPPTPNKVSTAKDQVALCFPAGAQYVGIGQALPHSEPVFRQTVDRCARSSILLGRDLRESFSRTGRWPPSVARRRCSRSPLIYDRVRAHRSGKAEIEPSAFVSTASAFVGACLAGVFFSKARVSLVRLGGSYSGRRVDARRACAAEVVERRLRPHRARHFRQARAGKNRCRTDRDHRRFRDGLKKDRIVSSSLCVVRSTQ